METKNPIHSVIYVIVAFSAIILSCSKKTIIEPVKPQTQNSAAKYDTVTSLAEMNSDAVIWKHNGEYILVTHENSTDEENEEEFESEENSGAKGINSVESGCSNTFAGSARKAAKTSYATAAGVTYASIAALRATLHTDAYMHTKGLTLTSPRIAEENRNVSMTTAYLYAISRESDNDYHMIIGDAPHTSSTLLNCECGGLPFSTTAASYATLKAVRDYIKNYFGTDFCGRSGYTIFSKPIKITVLKASLFYDIDHSPGSIGPKGYRANTSWEMHPISSITF